MREKILKYIKTLRKQEDKLRAELREWVVDESVPISERWEVFTLSELGEEHPFIVHFDSLKEVKSNRLNQYNRYGNLEDYFYTNNMERYQEVTVNDLLYWIIEMMTTGDEEGQFNITEKVVMNFERECLQKFIFKFRLDW